MCLTFGCWYDVEVSLLPTFQKIRFLMTRGSMALVYHLGVKNRPVGGRRSETQSHHIDMIIIMVL
jgi:hypothetical protein